MDNKSKLLSLAMAGALATGGAAIPTDAKASKVYCKGIAMKYANDCGANDHSCHYKAKSDWDKNEWITTASKEECDKLQAAVKDPAIKKYIEKIRNYTVKALKRGKKI